MYKDINSRMIYNNNEFETIKGITIYELLNKTMVDTLNIIK